MNRLPVFLLCYSVLFFCCLFTACKSAEPAFTQTPAPPATTAVLQPVSPNPPGTPQPSKPRVNKGEKISPDSAQALLKAAAKKAQLQQLNTRENFDDDDDDDDDDILSGSSKPIQTQKYIRREKEKGNWLSGGFLASGMILLIAALVLALIGSGPASLLAIIGGSLFLAGFIFTMVALLSR